MFDAFFDAFANVLNFFFELTGESYGGAIILLTLSVMIILTPLTLKSTRSMMRMQQLQPEMKRLQKEHKDDRQKLNEELMKFYKENNINPLGGCLPLLVQMPVFIVLFRTLQGLVGSTTTATEVNSPCQDSVPVGGECFVPKHLGEDTALFKALNATDETPGSATYTALWSDRDGVILPNSSAQLASGARNIRVSLGHNDFNGSQAVFDNIRPIVVE